jgi:hypothetical protein
MRGHVQTAAAPAKVEREADLGDFLSRLKSSGDVTGNLGQFSRSSRRT